MSRSSRANRNRAGLLVATLCTLVGPGCFPQLPLGVPGAWDYQALGAIGVPGAVFNAAALNTRFEHEALSVDTKVGPRKTFGRAYNTGDRAWRASWEMTYDGIDFVDARGTRYETQAVPAGSAIPGSYWVVVDGDTIKTKGGLSFDFDASGRLTGEHWSFAAFPQLRYAWEVGSLRVEECVSLAQQQSGQCRLIARIVYGAHGPTEIVDEVSAAAGQTRKASYAYDAEGRVVEAKTARQVAQGLDGTRYEYGTADLLTAQVLPDGERIEYDYAQTHLFEVRQVGEQDPVTRFDYLRNADGAWSVTHTSPTGGRTRYTVTTAHELTRIERIDLPDPEVMTVSWHPGLRRPASIVDFDGSVRDYPVWLDDDPATILEPSGNTVRYGYAPDAVNFENTRARPVSQVSDDLGVVVSVAYDPTTGLPQSRTNGEGEITTFGFVAGNLASTTSAWGDTTDFLSFGASGHWLDARSSAVPELTIHRKFDRVGNPLVPAAGLQRGGVLENAYDRDRQLESMQVAATDANGLVTATDAVDLVLRGDGQPLLISRPLGADHEFEYDALGRVVRVCERTEGTCSDTTLEYDAAGHQTAIERANGMREEIDYDLYGRVIAHRAFTNAVLQGEETFVWGEARIVSVTDSVRGETRSLAYDTAGRLSSVMHSAHGEVRSLSYDVRSRPVRESFVAPPPLGGGPASVLVLGYDHDLADRWVRLFIDDGSPGGEGLRERVIEDGRIVEVRDGNGNVREALFDVQTNRLIGFQMRDAQAVTLEDTTITRSVELAPTRFQVNTQTTTSLATTEEEYWLNRPGSLLDPNGKVGMRIFRALGWDDGVLAHDRTYAWDALSNIRDNAAGDAFTYNADRTRLAVASGNGWSHTYEYDAAGYVTNRDGLELAWTATGRVERVGPAAMPLALASWDLGGRLVSVETDGEYREFAWFGGRIESDTVNGGPGWLHLGGVSLPFAGAERRFRHDDVRGNTSVVTDESGAVVSHRRHHAFGLARVHGTSGSGGSSMLEQIVLSGFAGGVAAQALGLGFNGARVLDYDTGRFLSPDPILQTVNQVTYADGNPILFEDRDGLTSQPSSGGAGPTFVETALAVVGAFGAVGLAGVQVAAFNAAGVGAATLTATGVAVTAAFPAVVFATAIAVSAVGYAILQVLGFVQSVQQDTQSTSTAEDQIKVLEISADESEAQIQLRGRGGSGAPRRIGSGGLAAPIPNVASNPACAPIDRARLGATSVTLWLQLWALGVASTLALVIRTRSPRAEEVGHG